ncbi:hypothetical protein D3C74_427360 [compost metagenome]
MNRLHTNLHAESDESDQQIRIAYECNPFAVQIRMAVRQGIHYAAAFLHKGSRNWKTRQFTDCIQQLIRAGNPQRR